MFLYILDELERFIFRNLGIPDGDYNLEPVWHYRVETAPGLCKSVVKAVFQDQSVLYFFVTFNDENNTAKIDVFSKYDSFDLAPF